MQQLDDGVGPTRRNRPIDVGLVQDLLDLADPTKVSGPWNGIPDQPLFNRIKLYQRDVLRQRNPDGSIDPSGPTFRALSACVAAGGITPWHRQGNSAYPGRCFVDVSGFVGRFTALFRRQFDTCPAGLAVLTTFIMQDPAIGDIRWAAYMLATAEWETGHTFAPRKELGLGAGRAYGQSVAWKDAAGASHSGIYYGRGYVQLTWLDNYRALGKAIGLGDALALDPDKALEPAIAYQVMSVGMRTGAFTGLGLSRFIQGDKCEYYYARQIINALDQARPIARMAEKIEMLLRLATS
ncbi:MAG: hypothetical protein ACREF3_13975 [Acetobacteraceae bacterium]